MSCYLFPVLVSKCALSVWLFYYLLPRFFLAQMSLSHAHEGVATILQACFEMWRMHYNLRFCGLLVQHLRNPYKNIMAPLEWEVQLSLWQHGVKWASFITSRSGSCTLTHLGSFCSTHAVPPVHHAEDTAWQATCKHQKTIQDYNGATHPRLSSLSSHNDTCTQKSTNGSNSFKLN